MIRREGDVLVIAGAVTLETVPVLYARLTDELARGAQVVDFRDVTDVDSSCVALALECARGASRRDAPLRLVNLPVALRNLAELYGVSALLEPEAA